MKICIFGGSFNPPHKADKKILDRLTYMFNKVIVVPCGNRPDKPSANIVPLHDRMEMVRISFSGIKKVFVDFYDFENNVYTPTVSLHERYKKLYPNDEIWHLVGEDIVNDIKDWEPDGRKIWKELNFLIVKREGYCKIEGFPPHCEVLEIEDVIGSGTQIRKCVENNIPIDNLVELCVSKYIEDNKLYRNDTMKTKVEINKVEIDDLIRTFEEFKGKINKYKYPEEMFGRLNGASVDEKIDSLKRKFRKLMLDYGADRYQRYKSKEIIDILSEITRKIIELESLAEKTINEGTYGTTRNGNGFLIKGRKHHYSVESLYSEANFSQTFLATYKDIKNVCIKMARIADDDNVVFGIDKIESNNNLLNHEIDMLRNLDSINDDIFPKIRKQHFPVLVDDFMSISGYDGVDVERRAMVTEHVSAYDFVSLRERFPNGVSLYHACWMFARMLSAVGHLHHNGIIHGNIHPEGIFVNAKDHNVTLADFEFSINNYSAKDAKYIGATENYTAPEVYKGAKPHPITDIYSIGMSVIYILGGDIEKRKLPEKCEMIDVVNSNKIERERGIQGIKNLILSMVNQHPLARSDDAWKAYHQLTELRKLAFGKSGFIEFNVPE